MLVAVDKGARVSVLGLLGVEDGALVEVVRLMGQRSGFQDGQDFA